MKATKYIFSWHHWCGLAVGLLLLLMSITGSILAFADELEALEARSYPAVLPIEGKPNFDASFHAIHTTYPSHEIRMYDMPEQGKPLVYEIRQKEQRQKIFVHPVSGEIVGKDENANRSLQRSLLLLHYTLFAGTSGKVIVFITGCLFLVSLVTGIVIYRKSIIKALTFKIYFNRSTTRSFYSSLHRIIGVWSLLFNLLIVSTGLWLSGNIALTALQAPAASSPAKEPVNIISIDSAISVIRSQYPDYETHLIRTRAGSSVIGFSGRFTTDPLWYGKYYSTFTVDGARMEILNTSFMTNLPATERLKKMAGPLHFGNFGGIPLKIVYCLLGLTPGFLSVSGFIVWMKRKKSLKK